ncbi:hypothetical protein [Tautonia marina]|uniref:hypothetical protein n=1 Tax=Tautonia marina TaxID=2653855 RepID=UPI001260DFBB|nr:hypothetical protein [Tautonia marina]
MRDDWPGTLDDPGGDALRGRSRLQPPRFCPGCARPRRANHADLCPECGDRLQPQGYCTVCESFWPLPADAPCPKHDLPLAHEPPEPLLTLADHQPIDWVTVGSFPLPFQAEAARIRLDAEAIPTLIDGHRMASHGYHLLSGGIRLQVPRALAQDARIILSQSWSVPADDEDEDDDDWDEPARSIDPSSDITDWRSTLVFWGVVLSLLVVVGGLIGLIRS